MYVVDCSTFVLFRSASPGSNKDIVSCLHDKRILLSTRPSSAIRSFFPSSVGLPHLFSSSILFHPLVPHLSILPLLLPPTWPRAFINCPVNPACARWDLFPPQEVPAFIRSSLSLLLSLLVYLVGLLDLRLHTIAFIKTTLTLFGLQLYGSHMYNVHGLPSPYKANAYCIFPPISTKFTNFPQFTQNL